MFRMRNDDFIVDYDIKDNLELLFTRLKFQNIINKDTLINVIVESLEEDKVRELLERTLEGSIGRLRDSVQRLRDSVQRCFRIVIVFSSNSLMNIGNPCIIDILYPETGSYIFYKFTCRGDEDREYMIKDLEYAHVTYGNREIPWLKAKLYSFIGFLSLRILEVLSIDPIKLVSCGVAYSLLRENTYPFHYEIKFYEIFGSFFITSGSLGYFSFIATQLLREICLPRILNSSFKIELKKTIFL
jgi:hypothetical protein